MFSLRFASLFSALALLLPAGSYGADTLSLRHTLNGTTADNNFGHAVAISGNLVVIGVRYDDTGGAQSGRAYVYDLGSATPTVPVASLSNPTPSLSDNFGRAVAISGTRVAVAAYKDDTGEDHAGCVFVYDLASGSPTVPVAVLPNASPAGNDQFGNSVAISGTRVVVGDYQDDTRGNNAGGAYVYDLASGTPTVPVATLFPGTADNQWFGWSVAISGTRVAVGAPWGERAYVYDLGGGTPTVPVATLGKATPVGGDEFGHSVAISGMLVVVGVPGDDTTAFNGGNAYVYDLANESPTVPVAKLNRPGLPVSHLFLGKAVAISGTRVALGAEDSGKSGMSTVGIAYVYDLGTGSPTLVATLDNPSPTQGDYFGKPVAISGLQVVVGAIYDGTGGAYAGSAYVFAPPGPTATTSPVTTVSFSTATLPGTVNANGLTTTVNFEYGLDTNYGSTITASPATVSGNAPNNVTANVTGLGPGRQYHYRVVATNSEGTSQGEDGTFTTDAPAPGVSTSNATQVAATSATLAGSIDPNGAPTQYYFEYGLTGSYGTSTALTDTGSGDTSQDVIAPIAGLQPKSTYNFRIVAVNIKGTHPGQNQTFVTGSAPPLVTTGAATGVGQTGATINGVVNPNGETTQVVVEYGLTNAYGSTIAASPATFGGSNPVNVTASIADLAPGREYHYRVVATSVEGTTQGVDRTFITDAQPGVFTGNAAQVTTTGATLAGSIDPNGAPTQYYFEYGATQGYGTSTALTDLGSGDAFQDVFATLTGLQPNATYNFRVVAVNLKGSFPGQNQTFVTTPSGGGGPTASPAVTTGAANGIGQTAATIQGTVNPNGGTTFVQVEYGPTSAYGQSTTPQSIGSSASPVNTSVVLSGLSSGTLYHYRVVASNDLGTTNGGDGSFTTLFSPPSATTQSATPGTTFATVNGSINPNAVATTVFFEYGTTAALGSTANITGSFTGTNAQSVSATLSNLIPETIYHYRVTATSSAGTTQGDILTLSTLGAQAPVAVPDTMFVTVSQDATLNVIANDVNTDTGAIGTGLTFDGIVKQGQSGKVSGGPVISYDPNATIPEAGDSFQYRIKTAANQTAIGTVTVLPFAAVRGTYGGTITGQTATDGGSINPLELTPTGAFTATMNWQGSRYVVRSAFDNAGRSTLSKQKTGAPIGTNLTVDFELTAQGLITGTLSDGQTGRDFDFILRRAGAGDGGAAAVGAYTSHFEQPNGVAPASLRTRSEELEEIKIPGDGFTLTNVKQAKTKRMGRYIGRMGDGEPFTYGSTVFGDSLPLDAPLYPRKERTKKVFHGTVSGETLFTGASFDSIMQWVKQQGSSGLYQQGFRNGLLLRGEQLYADRRAASTTMLGILGGNVRLEFKAGDLNPSDPEAVMVADAQIQLSGARIVARVTSSDMQDLTLKIAPLSGMFSGSFKHPDPSVTKPVKFKGILRKLEDPAGRGNFRGPANAGSVRMFKS